MTLNNTNISIIRRLLSGKNTRPLRSILSKLAHAELASLFNHLNAREKNLYVDALIALDVASSVLTEVPEQQLKPILHSLDRNKLLVLLNYSSEDEAGEFLSTFSEEEAREILELVDPKRKVKLQLLMSYPEDSAGRLMNTQFFSLPASMSCNEATNELRTYAQAESIYYIYCVDED